MMAEADPEATGQISKAAFAKMMVKPASVELPVGIVKEVKSLLQKATGILDFVVGLMEAAHAGNTAKLQMAIVTAEAALGKRHPAIVIAKKGLQRVGPALQAKAQADALMVEVEKDEVRAILRRYGFTDDAIFSVVLGSTLLLVLVLIFLFLGYRSLVDQLDLTKSILAVTAVFGASAGISKANSPTEDGGRSIMLIVNFLVDQWKKARSNSEGDEFVFDSTAEALGTLKRAHVFHTAQATQTSKAT